MALACRGFSLSRHRKSGIADMHLDLVMPIPVINFQMPREMKGLTTLFQ